MAKNILGCVTPSFYFSTIMKRSFLPVLIAILILAGAGLIVTYVLFSREREFQKVEIPPSYLELADSSRFALQPILLSRKFKDDSVLVMFPQGNGRSQIYLYDQKSYNYFRMKVKNY